MPTTTRKISANKNAPIVALQTTCELEDITSVGIESMKLQLQQSIETMKLQFQQQVQLMQQQFATQIDELKAVYEATAKKQAVELLELKQSVNHLKVENKSLLRRLDQVEQNQLRNTLILSGPCVAEALAKVPADIPDRHKSMWAADEIMSKGLNLANNKYSITSALRLGRLPNNQTTDKRPLLLTVADCISKRNMFAAVLTKKSKNIYLNEYLTKSRKAILDSLLKLRKSNKGRYLQVFTVNGDITVKFEKDGRPHKIHNEADMERVIDQFTGE